MAIDRIHSNVLRNKYSSKVLAPSEIPSVVTRHHPRTLWLGPDETVTEIRLSREGRIPGDTVELRVLSDYPLDVIDDGSDDTIATLNYNEVVEFIYMENSDNPGYYLWLPLGRLETMYLHAGDFVLNTNASFANYQWGNRLYRLAVLPYSANTGYLATACAYVPVMWGGRHVERISLDWVPLSAGTGNVRFRVDWHTLGDRSQGATESDLGESLSYVDVDDASIASGYHHITELMSTYYISQKLYYNTGLSIVITRGGTYPGTPLYTGSVGLLGINVYVRAVNNYGAI